MPSADSRPHPPRPASMWLPTGSAHGAGQCARPPRIESLDRPASRTSIRKAGGRPGRAGGAVPNRQSDMKAPYRGGIRSTIRAASRVAYRRSPRRGLGRPCAGPGRERPTSKEVPCWRARSGLLPVTWRRGRRRRLDHADQRRAGWPSGTWLSNSSNGTNKAPMTMWTVIIAPRESRVKPSTAKSARRSSPVQAVSRAFPAGPTPRDLARSSRWTAPAAAASRSVTSAADG